jgi:hypothetical protein
MSKSSKKNSLKSIVSTSKKALPAVNKGLKKVGVAAKDVAQKSVPIVEKGVSVVYGTMARGFDLGVQGVKNMNKKMSKKRNSRRNRKTRKH